MLENMATVYKAERVVLARDLEDIPDPPAARRKPRCRRLHLLWIQFHAGVLERPRGKGHFEIGAHAERDLQHLQLLGTGGPQPQQFPTETPDEIVGRLPRRVIAILAVSVFQVIRRERPPTVSEPFGFLLNR